MPRKVFTNNDLPHLYPLNGWRKWAAKLPFVDFHQACFVQVLPNGDMVCHPDTLPYLREWFASQKIRYESVTRMEVVK